MLLIYILRDIPCILTLNILIPTTVLGNRKNLLKDNFYTYKARLCTTFYNI